MSGPAKIRVNTLAWQAQRWPVNSERRHVLLGVMENMPHTEAVAESGTGATRYFCTEHQFVYPINSECILCQAQDIEVTGAPPSAFPPIPIAAAVPNDGIAAQEANDANT